MKNGFYLELDDIRTSDEEATFGFLENEYHSNDFNAYLFLHGWCSNFAMALSEKYGYVIETVRHQRDGEPGKLIHAYCISEVNGQKAYIDIRGITTDADLFFEEFENEVTYDNGMLYDYDDDAVVQRYNSLEEYFDDGHDETDYVEEAKLLISKHKNHYDMNIFQKEFESYKEVVPLTEKDISQVEVLDNLSGNCVSDWLPDNDEFAWGLFKRNELIGYCTIGGADELYDVHEQSGSEIYPGFNRNSLLLSDAYIKPEHRNKNNASFMVKEVIDKVAGKYKELVFAVILDPKLARLYNKIGFENIDDYLIVNKSYYRKKPKYISLMTAIKDAENRTVNNQNNINKEINHFEK